MAALIRYLYSCKIHVLKIVNERNMKIREVIFRSGSPTIIPQIRNNLSSFISAAAEWQHPPVKEDFF